MLRALRRAVAPALLLVVTACGPQDGDARATPDADGTETPAASPASLRTGDLLVLDMDAGAAGADGEYAGVLFHARPDATRPERYGAPAIWASDARWIEPTDALILPGGAVLVLEQQGTHEDHTGRGGLYHVAGPGAAATLYWSDPRTRQPVAMARAPDGALYISDRQADPLGLGTRTGCVFVVEPAPDGTPHAASCRVAAAGAELVTPGALLHAADGRLLLMDADANPRGLLLEDGRPATPGVLYELLSDGLTSLLQPDRTVSPVAFVERRPGEIYLVDANAGTAASMLGDGALFRLTDAGMESVLDTASLGRPRALVDPVGGDTLPDGRLVLADANADPLGLGEDGTGKGVHGTGHGAILVVDTEALTLDVLLADERFRSPVAVRCVP
jgi:hypothetical protein